MINSDPNMSRKQIFKELPLPSKVEKVTFELIYKALFIIVKLLLDSRLNLVKISEGKPIQTRHKETLNNSQNPVISVKKVDNAVIKITDNIKVEETPSSREKPDKIKLGEEEKLEDVIVDPEKMETFKKGAELVTKKETKPKPEKSSEKFKEGSVNKGGVNEEPISPRPEEPPAGQAPKEGDK